MNSLKQKLKQDLLKNKDKIEKELEKYINSERDKCSYNLDGIIDDTKTLVEKILEYDNEDFQDSVIFEILKKEWEDYGSDHGKVKDIIDKFVYALDY